MTAFVGQRLASSLGQLGLLPFFALALLTWMVQGATLDELQIPQLTLSSLVACAAVILLRLGATHRDFALASRGRARPAFRQWLGRCILPSALGWLTSLMIFIGIRPWLVLVLLIGDLLRRRRMDTALLPHYRDAPDWHPSGRTRLTAGAPLALALAVPASF